MKKLLILMSILSGCGYVTQTELHSSQDALRTDLHGEIAQQSVATLECTQMVELARQANFACENFDVYCSVVQAYTDHCVRVDETTDALLPARVGVAQAMQRAIREETARRTRSSAEQSTEVPNSVTE